MLIRIQNMGWCTTQQSSSLIPMFTVASLLPGGRAGEISRESSAAAHEDLVERSSLQVARPAWPCWISWYVAYLRNSLLIHTCLVVIQADILPYLYKYDTVYIVHYRKLLITNTTKTLFVNFFSFGFSLCAPKSIFLFSLYSIWVLPLK